MKALRRCLDCPTLTRRSRCPRCEALWNRARNARRIQYQGSWRKLSRTARARQPWCSICGTRDDLTLDHEHGQVECRACNSRHRREPVT